MKTAIRAVGVASLPPLSWLWELDPSSGISVVRHGSSVEATSRAFFEGAWAGDFSTWGFDECADVFGSGGRIIDGVMVLVTPSHTLEPLYVLRISDRSFASNSLSFLLSYSGEELEPRHWRYGERFCSIVAGLTKTPQHLATQNGLLSIVYHHNILIRSDGSIEIKAKMLPRGFSKYEAYVDHLREVIARSVRNACSDDRSTRYRPITTLSSGYDSVACAVLARSVGCQESISLKSARDGDDDSGAAIASTLGLELIEFDRIGRSTGKDLDEDEFLASGMQAEDYVFRAFEPKLRRRVLFTGFHGDKVWEKTVQPTTRIKRGDVSGSSLGEFRLRTDFVHLPVPFIACQRHPDVGRISNSDEMQQFSVGGSYDRPIPRRIAEEAGVGRQMFGQEKKAVSLLFFWRQSLLSRATLADISRFRKRQRRSVSSEIKYALHASWWNIGRLLIWISKIRVPGRTRPSDGSAAGRGRKLFARFFGDFAIFEHSHPRNSLWIRWAVARLQQRYAAAKSPAFDALIRRP